MAKLLIKWGLKDELERRLGKDAPAQWTFINRERPHLRALCLLLKH